jgi:hypothetical protein
MIARLPQLAVAVVFPRKRHPIGAPGQPGQHAAAAAQASTGQATAPHRPSGLRSAPRLRQP